MIGLTIRYSSKDSTLGREDFQGKKQGVIHDKVRIPVITTQKFWFFHYDTVVLEDFYLVLPNKSFAFELVSVEADLEIV